MTECDAAICVECKDVGKAYEIMVDEKEQFQSFIDKKILRGLKGQRESFLNSKCIKGAAKPSFTSALELLLPSMSSVFVQINSSKNFLKIKKAEKRMKGSVIIITAMFLRSRVIFNFLLL